MSQQTLEIRDNLRAIRNCVLDHTEIIDEVLEYPETPKTRLLLRKHRELQDRGRELIREGLEMLRDELQNQEPRT